MLKFLEKSLPNVLFFERSRVTALVLPVFLEKSQVILNYFYFLLFPCDILSPNLLGNDLIFFCFFVVCRVLGLLLLLKSKKYKGSVLLLSFMGITRSPTHISLP